MPKKQRSDKRWEQNNYLVDVICPQLKSPTYIAVLWVCFRHGRGFGYFKISVGRIAKAARTSNRNVQRILRDFERYRLIELVDESTGTSPRTYRIRFKAETGGRISIDCNIQDDADGQEEMEANLEADQPQIDTVRGDTSTTPKNNHYPSLGVTPEAARGDRART